jgi:hypothetical protein
MILPHVSYVPFLRASSAVPGFEKTTWWWLQSSGTPVNDVCPLTGNEEESNKASAVPNAASPASESVTIDHFGL